MTYQHRARETRIRDAAQAHINDLHTTLVVRDRTARYTGQKALHLAEELAAAEATITRLRAEARRVSRAHIVRCAGCGDWVPYRATCTVCTILTNRADEHAA